MNIQNVLIKCKYNSVAVPTNKYLIWQIYVWTQIRETDAYLH